MTSSLLGPVLGGFFAEHLHWSVIFWINLPLGLDRARMIAYRGLKRLPRHDRPHSLDILGAVLMVAATVSLLLALELGRHALSVVLARRSPAFWPLSLVLWVVFALAHAAGARAPDSARRAAQSRRAHGHAGRLLRHGHLYRPHDLPAGLFRGRARHFREPIGPGVDSAHGRHGGGRHPVRPLHGARSAITSGFPLRALSSPSWPRGILARAARSCPFGPIEVMLGVLSIGLGTMLPVTTVSIQNAVALHELGTATGTANFFRSLGGAFIVALFGAIILGMSGLRGARQLREPGRGRFPQRRRSRRMCSATSSGRPLPASRWRSAS